MRLHAKAGVILIILGFGIFCLWTWWKKTRNFIPVNSPVSLVAGQSLTEQFQLNFDGLYLIEIEAEKSLPPDALHCLMGVWRDARQCKDVPSAIEANWILTSGGQQIKTGGTRDSPISFDEAGTLSRVIGEFQGKAREKYQLQITFTADGSRLSPANPRLKIAVASIAYTDMESASALVFSLAFICVLFGFILLAVAPHTLRSPNHAK
jgi:hypothetical protein